MIPLRFERVDKELMTVSKILQCRIIYSNAVFRIIRKKELLPVLVLYL